MCTCMCVHVCVCVGVYAYSWEMIGSCSASSSPSLSRHAWRVRVKILFLLLSSLCVWWCYHYFSSVIAGDTACWLWRIHVCIACVRSVCVIIFTHWEKMITSHNTLRRKNSILTIYYFFSCLWWYHVFFISSPQCACGDIISSYHFVIWYHCFSSVSGTLVHINARSSSFAESSPAHAPPTPPAGVFDLRVFVRGLESLRVCVRVWLCRIRVHAYAWSMSEQCFCVFMHQCTRYGCISDMLMYVYLYIYL